MALASCETYQDQGTPWTGGYPVSQILKCDTLYYPRHTSHHPGGPPSPHQGVNRGEYYSKSLRLSSKYKIEIRKDQLSSEVNWRIESLFLELQIRVQRIISPRDMTILLFTKQGFKSDPGMLCVM